MLQSAGLSEFHAAQLISCRTKLLLRIQDAAMAAAVAAAPKEGSTAAAKAALKEGDFVSASSIDSISRQASAVIRQAIHTARQASTVGSMRGPMEYPVLPALRLALAPKYAAAALPVADGNVGPSLGVSPAC